MPIFREIQKVIQHCFVLCPVKIRKSQPRFPSTVWPQVIVIIMHRAHVHPSFRGTASFATIMALTLCSFPVKTKLKY